MDSKIDCQLLSSVKTGAVDRLEKSGEDGHYRSKRHLPDGCGGLTRDKGGHQDLIVIDLDKRH